MVENSQPITSKIELQSQENASTLLLAQRRAMRLSLEERRQILHRQAQEMCKHYHKNTEWQELETDDIVDY